MDIVKISMVVPVYKVEKYLSLCLDSILGQSFSAIEVILVDDGSPDNCGKICDDYALRDSRVRVIHQVNSGVTAARRVGVENARGEFICFVDSDDYLPVSSVKILYDSIEDGEVDFVEGSLDMVTEEGKVLKRMCHQPKEYSGKEFYGLLPTGAFNAPWGCLYRKTLFDTNILDIPPEIKSGEDLIMKARLALKSRKVKVISNIVYYYLQRENSACHTFVYTLEYRKFFCEHLFRFGTNDIQEDWLERVKLEHVICLLRNVLTDNFNPRDPWLLGIEEAVRRLRFPLKKRLYLRLFTSPFARRVILFAHRYHLKDRLQACLGRGKK